MRTKTHVVDDGDLRKYRTELPNIIDDSELDVYEYRLYGHLKRRAGDSGRCIEGTRAMAQCCKMSPARIVTAKRSLESRGLIRITPGDKTTSTPDTIIIANVWRENFDRYTRSSDEHPVHTVNTPVHEMTTPCSPNEHPVHVVAQKKEQEQERTEIKKEPKNTSATQSAVADAPQPKPSKTERATTADPRSRHPAIQLVRTILGHYPKHLLYDDIIETLGEHPDGKQAMLCARTWVKRGFNQENLNGWLFDWYVNGLPENGQPRAGPMSKGDVTVNSVRTVLAEIEAKKCRAN